MQETARDHWANMAASEDVPEGLDDFGFHYPLSYVQTTCDLAILSNFHALPRAGGLDNQDDFWLQDLMTYLRGYARAKHDAKPVEHDDEDKPASIKRWNPYDGAG